MPALSKKRNSRHASWPVWLTWRCGHRCDTKRHRRGPVAAHAVCSAVALPNATAGLPASLRQHQFAQYKTTPPARCREARMNEEPRDASRERQRNSQADRESPSLRTAPATRLALRHTPNAAPFTRKAHAPTQSLPRARGRAVIRARSRAGRRRETKAESMPATQEGEKRGGARERKRAGEREAAGRSRAR